MITLKATKNHDFILSLKNAALQKPQMGVKLTLLQPFSGLKVLNIFDEKLSSLKGLNGSQVPSLILIKTYFIRLS